MGVRAAGSLIGVHVVLLVLLTVGVAAELRPLPEFDAAVATWAFDHTKTTPRWIEWCQALSHYGDPWALRAVLVAAAAVQVWWGRRGLAVWLVGVVVVETVVAPLAKFAIPRARPEWSDPLAVEPGLSYPSGHAAAAGMLMVSATLMVLMNSAARALRVALILTGGVVGGLIAASRIFLGVHFLSDVLAGLLLGSLLTLGTWLLMLRFRNRPRRSVLRDT